MAGSSAGRRNRDLSRLETDLALGAASWRSITSGDFQYHAAYLRQYHVQTRLVLMLGSPIGMSSTYGQIFAQKSCQIARWNRNEAVSCSGTRGRTIDLSLQMV